MNVENLVLEIEMLKERVKKIEGKRSNESSENTKSLGEMISKAVKDKAHPFFECDILMAREIAIAMHDLHPNEPFFRMERTEKDFTGVRRASIALGGLLGRLNLFPKLRTRFHVSADKRHNIPAATHNMHVWVLRNHDKYRHVSPSNLYHHYYAIKRKAQSEYQKSKQPSFL